MFYVLYPIGICAEWWLMYCSIQPAGRVTTWLRPLFYFLLALYVPGQLALSKRMMKDVLLTADRCMVHVLTHGPTTDESAEGKRLQADVSH